VSEPSIQEYNRLISYANCKIAILEMMVKPPSGFEMFVSDMREYFVSHYSSIVAHVSQLRENESDIKSNAYGGVCVVKPNYNMILAKMEEYYQLFTK
jgi:isochorismate hydrolase